MQTYPRKDKRERRQCAGWDCRKLLTYEKERSERNNHFFSLCGVIFRGTPDEDLIGFLKKELRPSDYVFQIPSTDEPDQVISKIGLLLPETDLPGAEVVRDRMNQVCSARKYQFQIGLASYPDDATIPGEILKKAFKKGLPREIDENMTEVE